MVIEGMMENAEMQDQRAKEDQLVQKVTLLSTLRILTIQES